MRRRIVLIAVWATGLAVIWLGLRATASRAVPFGPGDWRVVGTVGDGPQVAVAAMAVERDHHGWTAFVGPVEVWDVDAGRRVASITVAAPGQQYVADASRRWLRVLPASPDGRDEPPVVFDLTDGRELCRTTQPVYWSIPQESGGRVTVLALDEPTGRYWVTVYDSSTGAVVWEADEYPWLVAAEHVVSCPFNKHNQKPLAGPWTVRRSSDGAVIGVIPAAGGPLATDGRVLLTADGAVWDVATATQRFQLTGLPGWGHPNQATLSPDGRWLVVLRTTPTGQAACWHDLTTGTEEVSRRVNAPAAGKLYLWRHVSGWVNLELSESPPPTLYDSVRRWLPILPPPANPMQPILRYDTDTGRRLPDGNPEAFVERPDGRPLLTGDQMTRRPQRVWADRPGWLFPVLAGGWTLSALALACWRRGRARMSRSGRGG